MRSDGRYLLRKGYMAGLPKDLPSGPLLLNPRASAMARKAGGIGSLNFAIATSYIFLYIMSGEFRRGLRAEDEEAHACNI